MTDRITGGVDTHLEVHIAVGVEAPGSFGAGLTRHLLANEVKVVEVDRPKCQNRRRRGKSDTVEAIAAVLYSSAVCQRPAPRST